MKKWRQGTFILSYSAIVHVKDGQFEEKGENRWITLCILSLCRCPSSLFSPLVSHFLTLLQAIGMVSRSMKTNKLKQWEGVNGSGESQRDNGKGREESKWRKETFSLLGMSQQFSSWLTVPGFPWLMHWLHYQKEGHTKRHIFFSCSLWLFVKYCFHFLP